MAEKKPMLNGWLKFVITIFIALAAWLVTYGAMCQKVDNIETNGSKLARDNEKAIIEIKKDTEYLKNGQDDMKRDIRRIARKIGAADERAD